MIRAVLVGMTTVFAVSAALAQQSQPLLSRPDASSTINTADTLAGTRATTRDAVDTTNRPDEKFLKTFARANAAEVNFGKLAAIKTENPEVKAFAQQVVDDHSNTIGMVQAIASNANVGVKARPAFMDKAKSALLDVNVGNSFDRAYLKAMIEDHEKIVAMLQNEIRDGQDASVKQLASRALADVQEHLKIAQDLHATISSEEYLSPAPSRSKSNTPERLAATP